MKVFSVSYLPPMGLNAAGYQRAYGDLATIREILRLTITSSLQYQCFTERHCMEVLTLLVQVICTFCTFALVHSCTVVHKLYGIAVQQLTDLQCISKASMTCHRCSLAAASIVLSLYSHSGYCRDDSRQYMTISACPAAVVFLGPCPKKEPKRGRLQCISRGFHPLDVWTVILSDSPWTADRCSRKKSPDSAYSVAGLQ